MFHCRVIGTVVATRKEPRLAGHKFLIAQRLTSTNEKDGEPFVAIDHTQAGPGDYVIVARGKDAAWPIGRNAPVDMGIVGIIDRIDLSSAVDSPIQ